MTGRMAGREGDGLANVEAPRPRVLVVEDDPSMREFIELALEEVDAELLLAAGVDEALPLIAAGPVDVLLTDLALGERSGLELLAHLGPAGARPAATVIVFSGGIDEAREAELRAHGVWRVVRKPAPVAALEAVVRGALAERASASWPASPACGPGTAGAGAGSTSDFAAPAPVLRPGTAPVDEDALVATWFAGERSLYEQFLVSCRPRLAAAVAEGDAAVQAMDTATLASLCHRLKTLLRMLGAEADARVAAAVETALPADAAGGLALWQALRRRLLAHATSPRP